MRITDNLGFKTQIKFRRTRLRNTEHQNPRIKTSLTLNKFLTRNDGLRKAIRLRLDKRPHLDQLNNIAELYDQSAKRVEEDITLLKKIPVLRMILLGNKFTHHMYRVATLVDMQAQKDGRFEKKIITSLRVGALLHDAGKPFIFGWTGPLQSLSEKHYGKPEQFTRDDHLVGKRHTIFTSIVIGLGKRILERYIPEVDWGIVQEIVGGHHDGIFSDSSRDFDDREIQQYFRKSTKRLFDGYRISQNLEISNGRRNFDQSLFLYGITTRVQIADWISGLYVDRRNYQGKSNEAHSFITSFISHRFSNKFIYDALFEESVAYAREKEITESERQAMVSFVSEKVLEITQPLVSTSLNDCKYLPKVRGGVIHRIEINQDDVTQSERQYFRYYISQATILAQQRMSKFYGDNYESAYSRSLDHALVLAKNDSSFVDSRGLHGFVGDD